MNDAAIRAEIEKLMANAVVVGQDPSEFDARVPWSDPQPIPNDLPPVAPFDYTMLPDAFVPNVNDVAERMQCPPDFPAAAIMVALPGAVGKKAGIRPKRQDDWLVVPNLWGRSSGGLAS